MVTLSAFICALLAALASGVPVQEDELAAIRTRFKALEKGCYDMNSTMYLSTEGKQVKPNERLRWTGAVVPYVWDPNSRWNWNEADVIYRGMKMITDNTCVRFVERTNQPNYIVIKDTNGGCWATMGMIGGAQDVSLSRQGNCVHDGTVGHELYHALGVNHEHVRPDRDRYINIYLQNVQQGRAYNFDIDYDTVNLGFEYDLTSIMHYHSTAFSANGRPTMLSKIPGKPLTDSGNWYPSWSDIQKLRIMYKCR